MDLTRSSASDVVGARSHPAIRCATTADAESLVQLWSECAAAADEGSEAFTQQALWREPDIAEAIEALEFNLASPSRRIIVAEVDGAIIGASVCDIRTLTPISTTRMLVVTEIQVLPQQRRRSVAATLLTAVADYGEANSCEIVVAAIPAHAREPNRYLTKLGFHQIAVVRAITASKLRSRLSTKATSSPNTGRMIAVRRTLRRRQPND